SIGATLYKAVEAADILSEKYDMDAEVIDARSLVPFNYQPVLDSIKKTGKILLISDASSRGSYLKDMAATIAELAFDDLDAPPVVVGSKNWIVPAHELEDFFFPQVDWILDAIHEKIIPLKGHSVKEDLSDKTRIEKLARGI
ncbi:MAG: dehydrogenase, partial [Bacteroidetes bacterium]